MNEKLSITTEKKKHNEKNKKRKTVKNKKSPALAVQSKIYRACSHRWVSC